MDLLPCVGSPTRAAVSKLAYGMAVLALTFATPAFGSFVSLDPNGTDRCSVGPGSGLCAVTQAQGGVPGGNVNMNWLQLSGSGNSVFSQSANNYQLSLSASGGSDNSFFPAGSIPVSWDFILTSASANPVAWTASFTVGLGSGDYETTNNSGSAAPGAEVRGSNFIDFTSGGTVVFYNISVNLISNSPFSVDVPAGSTLDLNPAPAPEPGSMFLLATGAAGLLLRKMKRS